MKNIMSGKAYALITGASSGLGMHLAMQCAQKGYHLIMVALPLTGLEEAAAQIAEQTGREIHIVETDLTAETGALEVFEYCMRRKLPVNILVNNAGIGIESSFAALPVSFCTSLMQLNTIAVVQLTGLFLPLLQKMPSAFILNVSSLASYAPMPFNGIYAASKSFINSFSCSLRTELRGTAVSVSVLCPGPIPTNEAIRRRISNHGWFARAMLMEPELLAQIAIEELLSKKPVIIPGLLNRISRWMMLIVPTRLQQEILYRSYINKIENDLVVNVA